MSSAMSPRFAMTENTACTPMLARTPSRHGGLQQLWIRCGSAEVARAQPPVEQLQYQFPAKPRQRRIVARAFVAHEGVGGVELVPGEARAHLFQARLNKVAALQRNVGILPPPNVQQLALDVAGAGERIVVHAFAQAVLVNIGSVETGGGSHLRIHGSAKRQMPADADAHHPQPSGAMLKR